jgi:predicted nucleic acid-binding protein
LTIYADSSFFVSYYVQDSHSAETDRRMTQKPSVWITPFHRVELAHAIHQYVFRGNLSPVEAQQAWKDFKADSIRGLWILTDFPAGTWETCIDQACKYVPTYGVRTLDSLHVACALELKARRFWTFDERQARLAEAVGLDTNPQLVI